MAWSDDTHREVERLFGEAQAKGRRRMVTGPKTTRPPMTRLARISAALGRIALAIEDLERDEQEEALGTALALIAGDEDEPAEEPARPRPRRARGATARPGPRPEATAQGEVVKALKDHGPMTLTEIASKAGRSPSTVHHALARLSQAGQVERSPEGKGLFRLVA